MFLINNLCVTLIDAKGWGEFKDFVLSKYGFFVERYYKNKYLLHRVNVTDFILNLYAAYLL